jgi:hypothetical protein
LGLRNNLTKELRINRNISSLANGVARRFELFGTALKCTVLSITERAWGDLGGAALWRVELSIDHATRAAPIAQQYNNSDIILRGAKQIALAVGLPKRSIEWMLSQRHLTSPRLIGHTWYIPRRELLREFGIESEVS